MNLWIWDPALFLIGIAGLGPLLRVPFRLRKYVGEKLVMIYVTAIVAVFVFGYLVAAMVRPEWF